MATKKTTSKKSTSKATKTTKKTVSTINIHANGKIAKIKKDDNCAQSINDFVVDKMRIGTFQLVTQPDDSGNIVRVADVAGSTHTDLYVREKNKAQ